MIVSSRSAFARWRAGACAGAVVAGLAVGIANVTSTPTRQWVTDAPVRAAATFGDIAYLGGGFNYLGVVTSDGPSFIEQSSGALSAGCATRTGSQSGVRPAVVADSSGGLFMQVPLVGDRLVDAAGEFQVPSGHSFVRVGSDCRFVRSFRLETFVPGDSQTRGLTIARAGDLIYVGGTRTLGFGDPFGRVAAFNGTTGARINAWDFDQFRTVLVEGVTPDGQLVVTVTLRSDSGSTQEVGILQPASGFYLQLASIASLGSFVRVTGTTLYVLPAANRPLQAFDLATRLPKPGWGSPVLTITDLEAGGGRLFVAGSGLGRRGVFALAESSGSLIEGFAPQLGAAAGALLSVERMALVDSRLFVRGRTLRTLGSSSRYLLAAVHAVTGEADPWAPLAFASTDASIDLVPLAARLFVGRVFAPVVERRRHVAAVNTATGAVLPFNPNGTDVAMVPPVTALAANATYVFAGTAQGQLRRAAISTGLLDPWTVTVSGPGGQPGAVTALRLDQATLYAGGYFTTAATSSQPAPVARGHGLAVSSTSADLLPWNPSVTSPATGPTDARPPIGSLTRSSDGLVLGGNFSAVGGQPRWGLAAVDPGTGSPVVPALTLGESEVVLDTDQDGDQTYFVGVDENDSPLIGVADRQGATRWETGAATAAPSAGIAWLGGVVYSGVEWDVESGRPEPSSPEWRRPVAADTGLLELADYPDGDEGPAVTRFHAASQGNVLTAPRELAVQYSGTEVYLSWRAPARGSVMSYVIRAGPVTGQSNLADFDTGTSATSLWTRAPEGVYYVRVHARGPEGISGPSNEVAFALVPLGCNAAPRAPASLAGSVDADGVALQWGVAVGATSYLIEAGSRSGASDVAVLDLAARTGLRTPAPPGRYFVRARGVNSCAQGTASNEITLLVGTPPGAPSNLVVQLIGRTATLTWDAPSTGEVPTFYQLEAGTAPGLADVAVTRTTDRVLVVSGAAPGTYFVRARAGNGAGLGPPTPDVPAIVTP